MTEETLEEVLRDVRRTLIEVEAEISDAVLSLEAGGDGGVEGVEDFLAQAMSRLKILDQRLRRLLEEGNQHAR